LHTFLFFLACGLAPLLGYSPAPGATALNQLLALFGWGLVALMTTPAVSSSATRSRRLLMALGLWAILGALQAVLSTLPAALALPPIMLLVAAGALVLVAQSVQQHSREPLRAAYVAFAVLGALHAGIAVIQVFAPHAADGTLIATSGLSGRAVGNLRQPNHLSSLAVWSAVAVVPLIQWVPRVRWILAALFGAIVLTIELSASRTGMLGVVALAVWGACDRRLPAFTRGLLLSGLLIYALGWWGMSWWAEQQHHVFAAAKRLEESDLSGSRWAIWSNTIDLIKANPWTGVGFGEFNFAWTLTQFPDRPTAFFDHSHNIVLQLVVELGIPLGGLVVVLLATALLEAFRRAWGVEGERGVGYRAAFVMVLLIGIHSMLEYPLWYAYFLLPAAWLWGSCLGALKEAPPAGPAEAPSMFARAFPVVAGSLMIAGAAVAFQQYLTVSRIFEPRGDNRALDVRIAEGQRSIFFGHHAHYAAATTAERPSDAWDSFGVATYYLLDTRLMIAWANAFADRGDLDRARHLAQRLREFKRPEAEEFFSSCNTKQPWSTRPYQCDPPSRRVDWREFR